MDSTDYLRFAREDLDAQERYYESLWSRRHALIGLIALVGAASLTELKFIWVAQSLPCALNTLLWITVIPVWLLLAASIAYILRSAWPRRDFQPKTVFESLAWRKQRVEELKGKAFENADPKAEEEMVAGMTTEYARSASTNRSQNRIRERLLTRATVALICATISLGFQSAVLIVGLLFMESRT